jgi:two-component system, OmpR family, phosphate regulon sensor histidine kinase PhoR
MKELNLFYRKNIFLISVFLVLVVSSLVVGLTVAFTLTRKYIENEFYSKKIDVLEATINPYNDLSQNKIPEISFYQGFLDSASTAKYVDTVFRKYPFVERVVFFDVAVSNRPAEDAFQINRLSLTPRGVYQFARNNHPDSVVIYKSGSGGNLSLKISNEFNKIAFKFSGFIELLDTTKAIDHDVSNVFYNITPNCITYMNIPRREDMRIFKELMYHDLPSSPVYEQDVMIFFLTPAKLKVINAHSELYQKIEIKPLMFESLDTDPDLMSTEIPLYGSFAGYKLHFTSSKKFLRKEIIRRYFPIAFSILLVYAVLTFIGFLIYRNLNINRRMFKLQYDFINNLTHEFKTPVSVIKIAGSNIRSARNLSDRERSHYGKILDEEADKLNDLLNKLLSFTQIENRSIQLKEEIINLDVFVQNIIDAYQIKYPDFVINCDIENVEHFKTDPVLFTSIFQNLIDNAYKYSAQKKELEIAIQREKRSVIFIFRDKGIGIPEEELKHIFKKFYRIQNQFNQQGSVGLGLAFCREVVNFMKGNISVKSEVGKGSEFTITLPYLV